MEGEALVRDDLLARAEDRGDLGLIVVFELGTMSPSR
jgi:hypothetical protein